MRALFLLLAVSCDAPTSTADEIPAEVTPEMRPAAIGSGPTLPLDSLQPVRLALPPNARSGPAPETISVRGPFRYGGVTRPGMHRWIADFPARPRGLFFHKAEPGMALQSGGVDLAYERHGDHDQATWTHDRRELTVYTPERLEPSGLTLVWPTATQRERSLNLNNSKLKPQTFLQHTIQTN